MNFEWTTRLAIGVSVIDNQHMELFSRFNNLFDTLTSSKNKLELVSAVRLLEDYVAAHFDTEEEVMDCYLYSAAAAHKAQHAAFEAEFASLKEQIVTSDISRTAAIDMLKRLGEWQVNHIDDMDYELGKYLRMARIVQRAA